MGVHVRGFVLKFRPCRDLYQSRIVEIALRKDAVVVRLGNARFCVCTTSVRDSGMKAAVTWFLSTEYAAGHWFLVACLSRMWRNYG